MNVCKQCLILIILFIRDRIDSEGSTALTDLIKNIVFVKITVLAISF